MPGDDGQRILVGLKQARNEGAFALLEVAQNPHLGAEADPGLPAPEGLVDESVVSDPDEGANREVDIG